MIRAAALALVLFAAGPAAADDFSWPAVASDAERERAEREHARAMQDGDDAVASAVAAEIPSVRQRLIDRALTAYEQAARARPDDPEAHFRALSVLRAFHFDCDFVEKSRCLFPLTPARAARLIEHALAFEALAPGDPRLVEEVLFTRALVRTKLATVADLRGARDDYGKLLARLPDDWSGAAVGNLAETYMMLGDLDRSIETYRRALATGADLGIEFGLAVALDRDEQVSEARALIADRGRRGVAQFRLALEVNDIFFVPAGEELYYLALTEEVLGDPDGAIALWDAFVASGAHPQYAERARQHARALRARHDGRGRPSPRGPRDLRGGTP